VAVLVVVEVAVFAADFAFVEDDDDEEDDDEEDELEELDELDELDELEELAPLRWYASANAAFTFKLG
jgi:hypothetical protein